MAISTVLIGPCGIETRKGYRCFFHDYVLIGLIAWTTTPWTLPCFFHDYVLIGPCGIETC